MLSGVTPDHFGSLFQMSVNLLSMLALIRYQSVIRLLCVLLGSSGLGRKAVGLMRPVQHMAGASGCSGSIGLAALTVRGRVLSVFGRKYAPL